MSRVTLDTTGEIWVGTFPGLGQVLIGPDGSIDTRVDAGIDTEPDTGVERHEALRHGWGIPLSHLRLGRSLISGTSMVDPDGHCLVTHGPMSETTDLALALTRLGWHVLAPRLQPVSWDDGRLVAHPNDTPFIVSRGRARQLDLDGEPVRHDTDCIRIELPTHDQARPVTGILQVRDRRGNLPPFAHLTGHDRFDRCSHLLIDWSVTERPATGRAATPPPPEQRMARALQLTRIPHAELTIAPPTSATDDVAPEEMALVEEWWSHIRQDTP
ncbi:MAG: hypothetical protein ACO3WU_07030 [Ilumatobacteraceae bacterium]